MPFPPKSGTGRGYGKKATPHLILVRACDHHQYPSALPVVLINSPFTWQAGGGTRRSPPRKSNPPGCISLRPCLRQINLPRSANSVPQSTLTVRLDRPDEKQMATSELQTDKQVPKPFTFPRNVSPLPRRNDYLRDKADGLRIFDFLIWIDTEKIDLFFWRDTSQKTGTVEKSR